MTHYQRLEAQWRREEREELLAGVFGVVLLIVSVVGLVMWLSSCAPRVPPRAPREPEPAPDAGEYQPCRAGESWRPGLLTPEERRVLCAQGAPR